MRLTVTTLADEIFTFEVSDDMELDSFRALCEIETGISAREIVVFWNGRPLHDDRRNFIFSLLFFQAKISKSSINLYAVTIDPVTIKIANWLLIRQPEQ